jgi:4-hydroxymandelate oxidase
LTTLPLVLKGVRTAEDAQMAVDCGVNGILVSTHGGRQMDATLSAVESLPEIVEVCGARAEVYLDSGVRRGSDVLKALALGARAVGVGRPLYWGLAVNGAEGVHGMLEVLRQELDQVMGYCGQTDVQHLGPRLVTVPHGWGNGTMYP